MPNWSVSIPVIKSETQLFKINISITQRVAPVNSRLTIYDHPAATKQILSAQNSPPFFRCATHVWCPTDTVATYIRANLQWSAIACRSSLFVKFGSHHLCRSDSFRSHWNSGESCAVSLSDCFYKREKNSIRNQMELHFTIGNVYKCKSLKKYVKLKSCSVGWVFCVRFGNVEKNALANRAATKS